jgi:hypothetical protein
MDNDLIAVEMTRAEAVALAWCCDARTGRRGVAQRTPPDDAVIEAAHRALTIGLGETSPREHHPGRVDVDDDD